MNDVWFHLLDTGVGEPRLDDVAACADAALRHSGVLLPAGEVAIAVGSRGIRDALTVLHRVVIWARGQGCEPFIVPAMGSHGGATADGQRTVLGQYGFTEAAIGCEIRSCMDVIELPQGDSPVRVYTDALAHRAGATILINRVKPHTDFHGPIESGLLKMAAIGLGKRSGAELMHSDGARGLIDWLPVVSRQVLAQSNIALGVAIVENSRDETMAIEAIPAAQISEREPALLAAARRHMPKLPVDELDVLLIDRMGKDVSGVGMDTNVIGRMMILGVTDPVVPRISMIACHELTEASHGNACGMGLADVVTKRLADAIDHEVTRTNIVTSGFLLRGKLPVVADDDRQAWEFCRRGAHVGPDVRAIRILDTSHCHRLWATDAVRAKLKDRTGVRVLDSGLRLHDDAGRLMPFDP